ncbi:MAG: hypothetical protein HOV79_18650 [Hamadaea sp.]|nr:hypothetical protein [Hamadaea sp.]
MRAPLSLALAVALSVLSGCGADPAPVAPSAAASPRPSTPAELLTALIVADEDLTGALSWTRNADRDPDAPHLLPTCRGTERLWPAAEGQAMPGRHREWLASAEIGAAQWIYLRPVADAVAKQAQYAADDTGCAEYVEMETKYRLVPFTPAGPREAYTSCREGTEMAGAVTFSCTAILSKGTALVRLVSWGPAKTDAEAALTAVLEPAARRLAAAVG